MIKSIRGRMRPRKGSIEGFLTSRYSPYAFFKYIFKTDAEEKPKFDSVQFPIVNRKFC